MTQLLQNSSTGARSAIVKEALCLSLAQLLTCAQSLSVDSRCIETLIFPLCLLHPTGLDITMFVSLLTDAAIAYKQALRWLEYAFLEHPGCIVAFKH